jgi:ATP-dependent Clp protease adaptor protein ClpS
MAGSTRLQDQVHLKVDIREPSKYKVILLNDDYTPMDFVVNLIVSIFHKTAEEATHLMFEIHNKGFAVCGIYTFEIAETKVEQVSELARQSQYPLQCRMEKA